MAFSPLNSTIDQEPPGAKFDTSGPNPPPHLVKGQIQHPLGGLSCQNVLLPMSVVGGEEEGGGREGVGTRKEVESLNDRHIILKTPCIC